MDYSLIISLLTYFGFIKVQALGFLHWLACALLAIIVPFIISPVVIATILSGGSLDYGDIFTPITTVTLITQIIVAIALFYAIKVKEESLTTWIVLSIGGFVVLYLLIPTVVRLALL